MVPIVKFTGSLQISEKFGFRVNLLAQIPSTRLSEKGQSYPIHHFSLRYPNAFASKINKSSSTILNK